VVGILESKREQIAAACARHGVLRLDAFGSAVRGDFRPGDSDVDLLVEFGPMDVYARATPTSTCSMSSEASLARRSTS